jgi:hypothetical protein
MKIWIDGQIHDGTQKPIAIIFDPGDVEFISTMKPKERIFIKFPEHPGVNPDKEALAILARVTNALRLRHNAN